MNWLKDFSLYCRAEGLNPELESSRRRFETGASEVTITDGRLLTMDDINDLTGGLVGENITVQCPYCGIPGKTTMTIERPALGFAKWVCFYCGRHGEVRGKGPIDPAEEAEARRRAAELDRERREEKQLSALRLWNECIPIRDGDAVSRYLEARGIFELPPQVEGVLRFHPSCPFGPRTRRRCMVALMRHVLTDEPRAIHRTWLSNEGRALGKMAMGPIARAAVKLWTFAGDKLVVGEGIETVLSVTRTDKIRWREPLLPAWALTVANNIARLPVIEGVKRLVILVDNDESGVGPRAASLCAAAWRRAGREVIPLMPKQKGTDFNDIVRGTAP